MILAAKLSHRSILRIAGQDRHAFLQGLVSNDIQKVKRGKAIYAALLTPQGKFLHDMFIVESEDAFLVDCEAERAEDLLRRLAAFKLRSKVTFENLKDEMDVWAMWGEEDVHKKEPPPPTTRPRGAGGAFGNLAYTFLDPRLLELGGMGFVEKGKVPEDVTVCGFDEHDRHRLALGVADGSRDMEIEKTTLAEGNFDFLNGIDWKKGCYIGQELTARMHYRGLAKKRMFPVRIEGKAPPVGADLAGQGEMRSSNGVSGLALLKIEAVVEALDQQQPLTCGETKLWPRVPAWMKIDALPASR